jgi:hypothetical protein
MLAGSHRGHRAKIDLQRDPIDHVGDMMSGADHTTSMRARRVTADCISHIGAGHRDIEIGVQNGKQGVPGSAERRKAAFTPEFN